MHSDIFGGVSRGCGGTHTELGCGSSWKDCTETFADEGMEDRVAAPLKQSVAVEFGRAVVPRAGDSHETALERAGLECEDRVGYGREREVAPLDSSAPSPPAHTLAGLQVDLLVSSVCEQKRHTGAPGTALCYLTYCDGLPPTSGSRSVCNLSHKRFGRLDA